MPVLTASSSPVAKENTFPISNPSIDTLHRPSNFFASKHNDADSLSALILSHPHYNKATAFTENERDAFSLKGLLPPAIETLEKQVKRAYKQLVRFTVPLSQHIYLSSLRERNMTLFFRLVMDHLEEIMPLIYTPTVGEACLEYGLQFRSCEGMYISLQDKGHVKSILMNWKSNCLDETAIIVVTDGSRILGLGDLGACGMGIPIGKLALYVAAGGFHPMTTLPICIDVGTNNEKLIADEFYLGLRRHRVEDKQYYELMDEFMDAVRFRWPNTVVQFEDFSNDHCFELLSRYRDNYLCFNDDIQGTGAVIAAGFLNALRYKHLALTDCPVLFYGAGAAAIGVAEQIIRLYVKYYNMNYDVCKRMFYVIDSKGLITSDRPKNLEPYKKPFARTDLTYSNTHNLSLHDLVKLIKPKALIGLSGQPNQFTKEIISEMCTYYASPVIFPLSNPTSKAECTYQTAFDATNGHVVFASGSPFPPIKQNDILRKPAQGNNLYAFPGLGFGVWLSKAKKITDTIITEATIALAESVSDSQLEKGLLYPPLENIRDVSTKIAACVMEAVYKEGLSNLKQQPADYLQFVKQHQYLPRYIQESFK